MYGCRHTQLQIFLHVIFTNWSGYCQEFAYTRINVLCRQGTSQAKLQSTLAQSTGPSKNRWQPRELGTVARYWKCRCLVVLSTHAFTKERLDPNTLARIRLDHRMKEPPNGTTKGNCSWTKHRYVHRIFRRSVHWNLWKTPNPLVHNQAHHQLCYFCLVKNMIFILLPPHTICPTLVIL